MSGKALSPHSGQWAGYIKWGAMDQSRPVRGSHVAQATRRGRGVCWVA